MLAMSLKPIVRKNAVARSFGLIALLIAACGGASESPAPAPAGNDQQGSGSGNASTAPSETPTTPAPNPTTPAPNPAPPAVTAKECFKDLAGSIPGPDYDKFNPTIAKNCAGTAHQTIAGVQKVVFLGDSVTVGTPPTAPNDFYRNRLEGLMKAKFGATTEFASCAKWGARIDDLLEGGKQIEQCFPGGVENKKTLVVMTNGGNDIHAWAKGKMSTAEATAKADEAIVLLKTALEWLKSPAHFPNGSFVVFSNVYEYTDSSGDLSSCPTAQLAGMSGTWPEGAPAIVHFEEEFMHTAVQTKTDMMFLFEHFCGHGYKRNDTNLQCYRGANAPLWFDATCIHPNPDGHDQIAKQFAKVIDGT
jgi:hypothetical protein